PAVGPTTFHEPQSSPLSSRADYLACGEVMKSMNKTRPKFAVDSIWFNILYIGRGWDFFDFAQNGYRR
ncbi:MAG: hypothetical protein QOE55_2509, partial [Acidobacteriaceae bacterium]|nr:hypothetical protein [Acidobacteriaceae bacterium]